MCSSSSLPSKRPQDAASSPQKSSRCIRFPSKFPLKVPHKVPLKVPLKAPLKVLLKVPLKVLLKVPLKFLKMQQVPLKVAARSTGIVSNYCLTLFFCFKLQTKPGWGGRQTHGRVSCSLGLKHSWLSNSANSDQPTPLQPTPGPSAQPYLAMFYLNILYIV